MTAEEIVRNYQIKLMKIIFKEIDSLMTKKENADINAHKLAENGNSVRTSAYWKSVGNAESSDGFVTFFIGIDFSAGRNVCTKNN